MTDERRYKCYACESKELSLIPIEKCTKCGSRDVHDVAVPTYRERKLSRIITEISDNNKGRPQHKNTTVFKATVEERLKVEERKRFT